MSIVMKASVFYIVFISFYLVASHGPPISRVPSAYPPRSTELRRGALTPNSSYIQRGLTLEADDDFILATGIMIDIEKKRALKKSTPTAPCSSSSVVPPLDLSSLNSELLDKAYLAFSMIDLVKKNILSTHG